MQHFLVELLRACPEYVLLRVGFGDPATNDVLVSEAATVVSTMDLGPGPLLMINGPMSLPVGMCLAHTAAPRFKAVACMDPTLRKYVVVASRRPDLRLGELLDDPDRDDADSPGNAEG